MAGAILTVTLDDAEVGAALARLTALGGDMTEMFDLIGAELVASTQDRFEDGRAPNGDAWTPSRRAREEGGKTLVERGNLMDLITHRPAPDHVVVGSNLVYALIHQRGGTIRPKAAGKLVFRIGENLIFADEVKIPARPYLGLSDEDEREIGAIAADFLRDTAEGRA